MATLSFYEKPVQKAQFTEIAQRQQAQADKAYEIQTNVMQQKVIAEQVRVQQIEKEAQVKVQEDKITIVSTGDQKSIGAHKLTAEMTEIAAQVPALFEALSGMKMSDLMSNVKQMTTRSDGDGKPIVDGNATK